jgi:hypothetical protein
MHAVALKNGLNLPIGQARQFGWPALGWKRPGGQSVQFVWKLSGWLEPGEQAVQALMPGWAE